MWYYTFEKYANNIIVVEYIYVVSRLPSVFYSWLYSITETSQVTENRQVLSSMTACWWALL
jgi:hypothetical protein